MTTATSLLDEPPLAPAAELMRTLGRLNHALERASRRMEADWGVTTQQRMLIRMVGKYPGTTVGQLASHLHLDPGTVSAAVDRLEQRGLVERRRTARDRRRVTLGLTSEGRAIDGSARGPVERALERSFATLTPDDVACARRVLELLSRSIVEVLDERVEGRVG